MKFSLFIAVTSSIAAASAAAFFTPAVTVKLVMSDLVESNIHADEAAFHAVNSVDAAREGLVLAHDYTTGPGPCHPFPGADAQDCLSLISDTLNDDIVVPCFDGRAIMTKGDCSIVTTCNAARKAPKDAVFRYLAARRALTAIGSCALSDYGSISGYYVADKGVKTCYLYPGNESSCQ